MALAETLESYRRYVRIILKTGQQGVHSAEEVRVAYNADTHEVFVAYVQTDLRDLPNDFPDDGAEANFAKRVIWPRFEKEIIASREN